jgi:ActD protein
MPLSPIHGLMAEFATPEAILAAARRARAEGYRDVEAYAPYSVEGLAEELGMRRTGIPSIVLGAGLAGAGVGFLMEYWSMAVDYSFDVGGRPFNSWPVYLPICFEVMVLVASFSALLGMMFLNGLPKLYRPVFHVPGFVRASQDRFFLCIEATDPRFDLERTRQFLAGLGAAEVVEVPQ